MEYKAIYKCRMCGARYAVHSGIDQDKAVEITAMLAAGVVCQVPARLPHRCDPELCRMGLADFQGWEADKLTEHPDGRTESGLLEE